MVWETCPAMYCRSFQVRSYLTGGRGALAGMSLASFEQAIQIARYETRPFVRLARRLDWARNHLPEPNARLESHALLDDPMHLDVQQTCRDRRFGGSGIPHSLSFGLATEDQTGKLRRQHLVWSEAMLRRLEQLMLERRGPRQSHTGSLRPRESVPWFEAVR